MISLRLRRENMLEYRVLGRVSFDILKNTYKNDRAENSSCTRNNVNCRSSAVWCWACARVDIFIIIAILPPLSRSAACAHFAQFSLFLLERNSRSVLCVTGTSRSQIMPWHLKELSLKTRVDEIRNFNKIGKAALKDTQLSLQFFSHPCNRKPNKLQLHVRLS